MLTDAELDELERLEMAATRGQWKVGEHADVEWDDPLACWHDHVDDGESESYYATGPSCKSALLARCDTEFIVASRNALPALLADLRSARATIAELEAKLLLAHEIAALGEKETRE